MMELYLKAVYEQACIFTNEKKRRKTGHEIVAIWSVVRAEFEKMSSDVLDIREFSDVNFIISEFSRIDPLGQTFRYPEDVKGNAHLNGINLINVDVLREYMKIFHDVVDGWYWRLFDLNDRKKTGEW